MTFNPEQYRDQQGRFATTGIPSPPHTGDNGREMPETTYFIPVKEDDGSVTIQGANGVEGATGYAHVDGRDMYELNEQRMRILFHTHPRTFESDTLRYRPVPGQPHLYEMQGNGGSMRVTADALEGLMETACEQHSAEWEENHPGAMSRRADLYEQYREETARMKQSFNGSEDEWRQLEQLTQTRYEMQWQEELDG